MRFKTAERVRTQFKSGGVPSSLPGEISLCLYRVAQESLRNTAKHANAKSVTLALSGKKDGITLSIEDTGDGFDLNRCRGKSGLGLISMEERVRLVNGKYTIRSARGRGTTVEVFVPLGGKGR